MKKIILFFLIFGIIVGGVFWLAGFSIQSHAKSVVSTVQAVMDKKTATPIPTIAPGVPVRIGIPKINVSAVVESVGMDAKGRMDVPKNAVDTAWYSPGYKPGMPGSAVIDGHLDRVTGAPAVFWNIKKLVPGDVIRVSEDNGKIYTFAVLRVVHYPYNAFPMQEVFGASQTPMLNLVTCNGVWDKNTKNYSDRLVVYSKLVSQN